MATRKKAKGKSKTRSTAKRKKTTAKKAAARKKTTTARKKRAKKTPARRASARKAARPAKPPAAAPLPTAPKRPAPAPRPKPPVKPAAAAPIAKPPAQAAPAEERIGVVTHYFSHLSVATLRLERGTLRVGDTIHIHGHTTDFTQKIESLEVDHASVNEVGPNDDFGLKVVEHAREHDVVYRVRGV